MQIRVAVVVAMTGCLLGGLASAAEEAGSSDSKGDKPYVVAPLVMVNPAFGTGLGAMGLVFFNPSKRDTVSPPSSLTVMGAYSDTDSYMLAAFAMLYLKEDLWRVVMGLPNARLRNSFDVEGLGDVRFDTEVHVGFIRVQRRVMDHLYVGLQGSLSDITYDARNEAARLYFEALEIEDNTAGMLGIALQYDTRDHERYPEHGILSDVSFTYAPEAWGTVEEYHVTSADVNSYHRLAERQVLALRAAARLTPVGTPYSGLSALGRRSDLRGYVNGEKVAENLLSTQAEYRRFFTSKLGAVAFIGVAGLYDGSIDNLDSDTTYFSGGVGLRYVLHEANRVNFRIDYAWGEDDEEGLYVSMREAF